MSDKPQRVIIVSDTHGWVDPRVIAEISPDDIVVHAGDIGSAGVLDACSKAHRLVAVAGNNDVAAKWASDELEVLAGLPEQHELDLPGGRLVVIHGHQFPQVRSRHARLRETFSHARCVVYGHSHRRVVDDDFEPWVVNPGAAGKTRAHGGTGFLRLDISEANWSLQSVTLPVA